MKQIQAQWFELDSDYKFVSDEPPVTLPFRETLRMYYVALPSGKVIGLKKFTRFEVERKSFQHYYGNKETKFIQFKLIEREVIQ